MNSNTITALNRLKEQLEAKLAAIDLLHRPMEKANAGVHTIQEHIVQLKNMRPEEFEDQETEIHFYKYIIPFFYGQLIFFVRVFQLQSTLPGTFATRRKCFTKELKRIEHFYKDNLAAYQYFNTDDQSLDTGLFVADTPVSPVGIDETLLLADSQYCTPMGLKFARFIGYKELQDYLNHQLRKEKPASLPCDKSSFKWTDKKAYLQELTYALVYSNSINNGNIDVKSLARLFESIFNIDLSNIYRAKQEMYTRKETTAYLNKLIQRFKQGMDDADDRNNHIM